MLLSHVKFIQNVAKNKKIIEVARASKRALKLGVQNVGRTTKPSYHSSPSDVQFLIPEFLISHNISDKRIDNLLEDEE